MRLSLGLFFAAFVSRSDALYNVILTDHSPTPILSSANPPGQGSSHGCLIFNPSAIVSPSSASGVQEGLLVRECCGVSCTGHGYRHLENGVVVEPHAERISFAPCDLNVGTCEDALPSTAFNLDPDADAEDPRALFNPYDGYYYLFYYRSPAVSQSKCTGDLCNVQLSRTKTPLNASSYEYIATLPWHRNGCCWIRPKGEKTYCMWGEGPSPLPGLGISTTTDISTGDFTQVTWTSRGNNVTSPLTPDGNWILPLGEKENEIKLEAGTHFHQLDDGNLLTFYAAATPGWVAHGNYTVGWLIVDGKDPSTIIQRGAHHILVPTFDYETLCPGEKDCKYKGERHNVIFLSSMVRLKGKKNTFRLFYGAGDGNVGTAVVTVAVV